MPGSSLWLTPPPSHPLYEILTTLIESTLPKLLSHGPEESSSVSPHPPVFAPHVTLTSNIDPAVYGSDPQGWLDSLPFACPPSWRLKEEEEASLLEGSTTAPTVLFERVNSEDVFFRRCYLKCSFTDGVRLLAGVSRAWGVHGGDGKVRRRGDDGAQAMLVLGDKTENWLGEWKEAFGPHVSLMYGDMPIDEIKLKEIDQAVQEAGIQFSRAGADSDGHTGWEGGVIWLVSTERRIPEWKPIAQRTL